MIASRLAGADERTARTLYLVVSRPGQVPEEVAVTYAGHHRVSDPAGALAGHPASPGSPLAARSSN